MANEHDWTMELEHMRDQLRFALNNLDSISKRNDVKGKIESVCFALDDLCKQTKGESE